MSTEHPAVIVLLSFMKEISVWGHKSYALTVLEEEPFVIPEGYEELVKDYSEEHAEIEYEKIKNKYYTVKKRSFGAQGDSYCKNGEFHDYTVECVTDIQTENNNKATITVSPPESMKHQSTKKFTLLCQNGEWRIESMKSKIKEWKNDYLP